MDASDLTIPRRLQLARSTVLECRPNPTALAWRASHPASPPVPRDFATSDPINAVAAPGVVPRDNPGNHGAEQPEPGLRGGVPC